MPVLEITCNNKIRDSHNAPSVQMAVTLDSVASNLTVYHDATGWLNHQPGSLKFKIAWMTAEVSSSEV